MSAVFDSCFRNLLGELLRRAPRLRGDRQGELRGRRRRRTESGTFSGHRAYAAGEDLRLLDWNVYARTDELFLKVLEDQDLRGMTLVLDCSPSMRAGRRWESALRLAAVLGGVALSRLDGLHLVLARGRHHTLEGPRSLAAYLDLLAGLPVHDTPPLELARGALERGGHGRLVWVSDFADPETLRPAFRLLRHRGCVCTGWMPWIEDDRAPALAGYLRLEDPETGREEVLMVDAELRRAMGQELELLAALQDRVFARAGFGLRRFPVPDPADLRLRSWMAAFAGQGETRRGVWLERI